MGVKLNLSNSTQTQTTQVTSTAQHSTGPNDKVTSNGTGSSTVAISAAGVSNSYPIATQSDSCTDKLKFACTGTASANTKATNWVGNVLSGSLGSYVGGDNVTVARKAQSLIASQINSVFNGTESTQSTVNWTGDLSATYDYLLHAAPSFDGGALSLVMDFGTVLLGDAAPPLGFSIFSAVGDRVGLDLDGIVVTGDTGQLYSDLVAFSGLGAGSDQLFSASFDTGTVGDFSTTYTLSLSDADVGAENSRFNYTMTLNLKGSVIEPPSVRQPNDVPEPGIFALVSIGLFGLAITQRRSRPGTRRLLKVDRGL